MIANPFRMAMLAAPVLAALAYGARADIFTWVDESGTVNFTIDTASTTTSSAAHHDYTFQVTVN